MTNQPSPPPAAPSAGRPRANPRRSPWKLLRRGLVRHCPLCGSGKLFKHWTKMVADCPGCGYHFEREEGFFLGALVMNIIVTEFTLMVAIAIGFGVTLPHPPVVKLAIITGALGFTLPFFVYPFTKTVWTAVDLIMRKALGESYQGAAQPGFKAKGQ